MNKLSITILVIIFTISQVYSQTGTLRKGEKYFDIYSYNESIQKLEQITEKDTAVLRKLALSYFRIGNYLESAKYWSEVVKNEDAIPDDFYQYAYVLAINGLYPDSEYWMNRYSELASHDTRAQMHLANPGFYKLLLNGKGLFEINNLNINTYHSDFGTAFFNNKIVYASTRALPKPFKRIWNWNKLPYLDIYVADLDSTGQLVNIERFGSNFSSKYHDGPAAFNNDGTYMAFTRNNYDEKNSEGIVKLKIYTSEKINGKWSKPKSLHFNSPEYSVGHPTLSANGNTMIFASDMPDGYGKSDLYVIYKDENGNWSDPKNLGRTINTEGNEMFPFIHPDGILFFSSDGLPGLGGLDVFYTNANDFLNLTMPINIGSPVNTNTDDFAFILNEEQSAGYFSSNRAEGQGDDDIFAFKLAEPFVLQKIIKGITFDNYKNILSNVEVVLYDNNEQIVSTAMSDENGNFQFVITKDDVYNVFGSIENYTNNTKEVDATGSEPVLQTELILTKKLQIQLYCIVTDFETNEIIPEVRINLKNLENDEVEVIVTSTSGAFEKDLGYKEMFDKLLYSLTLEKKGYLSQTFVYSNVIDRDGRYNVHEQMQVVMKKIDIGTDLAKIIDIQPIYFDLGKADIRPDAEIELNKIVEVMNENPKMVIELGSHTDCRGSSTSNNRLSERRAKSSAEYIKARITNPDRISGKGYGESRLVNHCECEGAKVVPCTEEEHQENRRTEFRIIKFE